MIFGVTGLLGGGKSLYSVVKMTEHLRNGLAVVTNIDLNVQQLSKVTGRSEDFISSRIFYVDPDDEDTSDPWTWVCGDRRGTGNRRVMVVIDEAGEWFSTIGERGRSNQAEWRSWLRQSDKRGQDVYLIVQDPSILAKQGRVLVHFWLKVINMDSWKFPGLGVRMPPPFNKFLRVQMYNSDGRTLVSRGSGDWVRRDPKYFKIYNTAAIFGKSGELDLSSGLNAYETDMVDDEMEDSSDFRIILGWVLAIQVFLIFIGMITR